MCCEMHTQASSRVKLCHTGTIAIWLACNGVKGEAIGIESNGCHASLFNCVKAPLRESATRGNDIMFIRNNK